MSHELEIFTNGQTAFVSGGNQDAWHRLGTVLPGKLTAQQVMTHAHLGGWNVKKQQVSTTLTDTIGETPVPGKYVTLRTNPVDGSEEIVGGDQFNGIVGGGYEPYQNESLIEYLQALTDESGAVFDTAGSLRGGADVFVTMRLPESMMVGGIDELNVNIAVLNNHTGARAITGLVTPVRIVCANTQAAALRDATASFKVRHTSKAGQRVQEAREALGLTWRYVEQFQQAADRMINETLVIDQFRKVVDEIWPPKTDQASDRSLTMARNRTSELAKLFQYGASNASIRDTRWAGYQAITEYLDHHAPVHGRTEHAKALNRAVRSIDGSVVDIKQRAFALLSR